MSEIGFIKPNYPNEKRVALLPKHIKEYRDCIAYTDIFIEQGFGEYLNIDDAAYTSVGCKVLSRQEIFHLPVLFSLKLIQPVDYDLLTEGQKIIGWMHPNGSGREFTQAIAAKKHISIFDIDSVYPRIYYPDGHSEDVIGLPKYFFWKNSFIAGMAATKLGLEATNFATKKQTRIAILGSGSVAQGAFCYTAQQGSQPRMFYRKTLNLFFEEIESFDIIINGIEIDSDGTHILDKTALNRTKPEVIIIDAAADAGRAIEGTKYLSIEHPLAQVEGRTYTLVNNAPTLMHEDASDFISEVVARLLLARDFFDPEFL